jgi:hypothetical protein
MKRLCPDKKRPKGVGSVTNRVNADALQELLGFLYAECCTRKKAVRPQAIMTLCK